jgi:HlyD family secretion protein
MVPAAGIYHVFAAPGQRIERVLVSENDSVVAGETQLVILEAEKLLELQTELVGSQGEDAKTEVEQKVLLAENNLTAAESAVETFKLKLAQATEAVDLSVLEKQIKAAKDRIERLTELQLDPDTSLFVSQGEIEEKKLKIEQSQSQLDTAKRQQAASVQAAELGLTTAIKSKDSAERSLAALQKLNQEDTSIKLSKQIAEDRRESAKIETPINGTVLKVSVKQGDVVGPTPLMQIADLSAMNCLVEVFDRLVGEVEVGQSVTISSPALSKDVRGKVVEIGRIVGNSTLSQPNPLAMVDRKTVEVTVAIVDEDVEVASRLVNLQVDVEIKTASGPSEQN